MFFPFGWQMLPKFLLGTHSTNGIAHFTPTLKRFSPSLHRIDEYLKEDELKNVPLTDVNARNRIGFENATISWMFSAAHEERSRSSSPSNANKPFAIRDVTLEFPTSQLSIICGSTGSGKTLLMMRLLGEARIVSGRSYCFQSQVSEDITADDADADISNDNWIVGDRIAYVAQNGKLIDELVHA